MLKLSCTNGLPIFLSVSIMLACVGCSSDNTTNGESKNQQPTPTVSTPAAANSPIAKPSAQAVKQNQTASSYSYGSDNYEQALYRAARAQSISESAQSREDWKLVSTQWQQVVALLKAVPPNSPNYNQAKTKLKEFQEQLDYAQQQADPRVKPIAPISKCIAKRNTKTASGTVYRVPIKRREFGTVVIDVTFSNYNLKQSFEMMLDTGASGTAITSQMAAEMKVETLGVAGVSTANGKALVGVGCLDSIQVGGAVLKNVAVAIPPGLDIGLLGQNFFGGYDVTIKNNFVEFRVR